MIIAEHPAPWNETVAVGIVADDLTGANDSAVQFARDGWRTRLTLVNPTPGSIEPRSVLAVVTDSRAQNGETARASTASAVTALDEAGIDRMFLKIDSTMRGSVIEQIHGALDAWSTHQPGAFAVVCSAYPAMGRTIQDGQILVNGAGVETTAIGRDPVTPVTTSALSDLLPGSVSVALLPGSAADHTAQIETAMVDGARVITVDAVTEKDLQSIAEAVASLGARAVPVGAAGLAVAMSSVWAGRTRADQAQPTNIVTAAERVVVVVSSLHDVSRAQCTCLVDSLPTDEVRTLAPPLEKLVDPGAVAPWLSRELASVPDLPRIVVITSPTERPAYTAGEMRAETASMAIASGLATITEAVFDHQKVGALVLVGGEGARAILDRFDADAILVNDAIREGIPIGVIEGGRANGLTVVTKAGGFGTVSSLADIVPELLNNQTHGEES